MIYSKLHAKVKTFNIYWLWPDDVDFSLHLVYFYLQYCVDNYRALVYLQINGCAFPPGAGGLGLLPNVIL